MQKDLTMEAIPPSGIPPNTPLGQTLQEHSSIPTDMTITSPTTIQKNVEKASERGHSILKKAGSVAKAIGKGGAIVGGVIIFTSAAFLFAIVRVPLGVLSLTLRGVLFFVPFVPGKELTNLVTGIIRYPLIGLFIASTSLMKLGGVREDLTKMWLASAKAVVNETRWNTEK